MKKISVLSLLCLIILTGTSLALDIQQYLTKLGSENPAEVEQAVRKLVELDDEGLTNILLLELQRPGADIWISAEVARILGLRKDKNAVPTLMEMLKEDLRIRSGAWSYLIPTLGMIGDSRAVPLLIETLNKRDEKWLGREMSARALGMIGDARATPWLVNAAWMADTRAVSIEALARIGGPGGVEVLIDALSDEEAEVRKNAREGLVRIGSHSLDRLEQKRKVLLGDPRSASELERVEEVIFKLKRQEAEHSAEMPVTQQKQ